MTHRFEPQKQSDRDAQFEALDTSFGYNCSMRLWFKEDVSAVPHTRRYSLTAMTSRCFDCAPRVCIRFANTKYLICRQPTATSARSSLLACPCSAT